MSQSCKGCKFLYFQDIGYSNWTVLDTEVCCALDKNPELPADEPYDWSKDPDHEDNWLKTMHRCECFKPGEMLEFDVEGEIRDDLLRDMNEGRGDLEQLKAVLGHET